MMDVQVYDKAQTEALLAKKLGVGTTTAEDVGALPTNPDQIKVGKGPSTTINRDSVELATGSVSTKLTKDAIVRKSGSSPVVTIHLPALNGTLALDEDVRLTPDATDWEINPPSSGLTVEWNAISKEWQLWQDRGGEMERKLESVNGDFTDRSVAFPIRSKTATRSITGYYLGLNKQIHLTVDALQDALEMDAPSAASENADGGDRSRVRALFTTDNPVLAQTLDGQNKITSDVTGSVIDADGKIYSPINGSSYSRSDGLVYKYAGFDGVWNDTWECTLDDGSVVGEVQYRRPDGAIFLWYDFLSAFGWQDTGIRKPGLNPENGDTLPSFDDPQGAITYHYTFHAAGSSVEHTDDLVRKSSLDLDEQGHPKDEKLAALCSSDNTILTGTINAKIAAAIGPVDDALDAALGEEVA